MTKPILALCSANAIDLEGDDAPEWIQLLPAGEIRTHDGRGPYRVADAKALMASSLPAGEKLVLDENHATDVAAPQGQSAPARGWIVELQAREGGIWGRVEWTSAGRAMVADKAYRGISPAILHAKDGVINRILRASLINAPNLIGMASLHQEGHDDMNWKEKLCELLGLASDAGDDAIVAALTDKLKGAGDQTALQSALSAIATAAGVASGADAATVLAGVRALKTAQGDDTLVAALQGQVTALSGTIETIKTDTAKKEAAAFVDAAITALKPGVKPMREHYISMHMENPKRTEDLLNALPSLQGMRLGGGLPKGTDAGELGEADLQVIALMGLDPEDYKKTLAAEAAQKEKL
jgi:phage I-like protein